MCFGEWVAEEPRLATISQVEVAAGMWAAKQAFRGGVDKVALRERFFAAAFQ